MAAAVTFEDVVLHVGALTPRLLFHELVHAVQYRHLGLEGFAERYVNGFLPGGSYAGIPLEKQAYELEARFAAKPRERAFRSKRRSPREFGGESSRRRLALIPGHRFFHVLWL
jgi:hypothetical protein